MEPIYPIETMKEIMDFVQDTYHWKNPISREVPQQLISEKGWTDDMIMEAVIWYTGSVPTFQDYWNEVKLDESWGTRHGVLVKAVGYYEAVGS